MNVILCTIKYSFPYQLAYNFGSRNSIREESHKNDWYILPGPGPRIEFPKVSWSIFLRASIYDFFFCWNLWWFGLRMEWPEISRLRRFPQFNQRYRKIWQAYWWFSVDLRYSHIKIHAMFLEMKRIARKNGQKLNFKYFMAFNK